MPDLKVTKDAAGDARVRVDMRREFFNVMAREGKVADWIEAFTYGQAKASGPEQFLRLIVNVVEKQQERQRTRASAAHHRASARGRRERAPDAAEPVGAAQW